MKSYIKTVIKLFMVIMLLFLCYFFINHLPISMRVNLAAENINKYEYTLMIENEENSVRNIKKDLSTLENGIEVKVPQTHEGFENSFLIDIKSKVGEIEKVNIIGVSFDFFGIRICDYNQEQISSSSSFIEVNKSEGILSVNSLALGINSSISNFILHIQIYSSVFILVMCLASYVIFKRYPINKEIIKNISIVGLSCLICCVVFYNYTDDFEIIHIKEDVSGTFVLVDKNSNEIFSVAEVGGVGDKQFKPNGSYLYFSLPDDLANVERSYSILNVNNNEFLEGNVELKLGDFKKNLSLSELDNSDLQSLMLLNKVSSTIVCLVLFLMCFNILNRFMKLLESFEKKSLKLSMENCKKIKLIYFVPLCYASFMLMINMFTYYYNRTYSTLEILAYIFSIYLFLYSFRKHKMSNKTMLFYITVVSIGIFISLDSLTQYLGVDEPRAINEQLNIVNDTLTHWNSGTARTNYLIMGTVMRLTPDVLFSWIGCDGYQYAKAVHWLFGFALLILIAKTICKHIINPIVEKKYHNFIYVIILISIMMLPQILVSMKYYTYDMFSLLFSLVSLLFVYIGFKNDDIKFCTYSVLFAFAGSQEKSIAVPILYLAIIVNGFVRLRRKSTKIMSAIVLFYAKTVLNIILLSYFYAIVVGLLRNLEFPSLAFTSVLKPTFGIGFINSIITKFSSESQINYILWAFLFISILIVSILYIWIRYEKIFFKIFIKEDLIKKVVKVCIFLVILISIIGCFIIPYAYIDTSALDSRYYLPNSIMNGMVYHFRSISYIDHIIKYLIFHFGVLIRNIPTVMVFISLIICMKKTKGDILQLLVCLGVFFIPICYAIVGVLPAAKYYNVFICLFVIIILMIFIVDVFTSGLKKKRLMLLCAISLMFVEVYQASPSFFSFTPIWDIQTRSISEKVPYGKYYGITGMWGEQNALACREIIQYIHDKELELQDVKVFYTYKGVWSENQENIPIISFPITTNEKGEKIPNISGLSFSENDFYIISRWPLMSNEQGITLPPTNIKPIFTISSGGVVTSWIYQGNEFKKMFE